MTAGGAAMGRTTWSVASNQIKALPSYVNVAAETTIDVNSRLMTVHVETYYTGSSPVASNNLNVALLQNNILGPQTAGNAGNNYKYQHRLMHMVTGQRGGVITTTTSGTFADITYIYIIPASYNGVPAEMGDFEVTAFIAEGNQKIISGNGSTITYTGLVVKDAKVFNIKPIITQCKPALSTTLTIQNSGQTPLTSLPITYNINSGIDQI